MAVSSRLLAFALLVASSLALYLAWRTQEGARERDAWKARWEKDTRALNAGLKSGTQTLADGKPADHAAADNPTAATAGPAEPHDQDSDCFDSGLLYGFSHGDVAHATQLMALLKKGAIVHGQEELVWMMIDSCLQTLSQNYDNVPVKPAIYAYLEAISRVNNHSALRAVLDYRVRCRHAGTETALEDRIKELSLRVQP